MKKKLLIANWKMNKTQKEIEDFFAHLKKPTSMQNTTVVIAPPFPYLKLVGQLNQDFKFLLAAQNLSSQEKGAFTGETSALMLKDCGVSYVLIGHSERRQLLGETDEQISQKIVRAMTHGLIPVLCLGEPLTVREKGRTEEYITHQIHAAMSSIGSNTTSLVVAYEPIWAIGSGKAASPADSQAIHQIIRAELVEIIGTEKAQATPILYGGSVTSKNLDSFLKETDIDGALVGGASLLPEEWGLFY